MDVPQADPYWCAAISIRHCRLPPRSIVIQSEPPDATSSTAADARSQRAHSAGHACTAGAGVAPGRSCRASSMRSEGFRV
jgi:hypothetical protein